jgi:hypothetical protein
MGGEHLILIELILVFGLVLGFGFWQLWSLRRERQRDRKADDDRAPPPAEPPGG